MDKNNSQNYREVDTTEFQGKRFRHVIGSAEDKVPADSGVKTWIQWFKKRFPEEQMVCAMEDCPKCKGRPRTTKLDGSHICLADDESAEYVVLICNSVNRGKNREAQFCIRPGLPALQVPVAPWWAYVLVGGLGLTLISAINGLGARIHAWRKTQPPPPPDPHYME